MAGHKINPKAKSKEEKGKSNRNSSPTNDDTEDPDFTILRKPVHTSVTGFAQARKVFDAATEELKNLLTNECDILYECKVCRNIFRSLANFISHKRIYCKETFNTSVHGHFVRTLSTASEISKIKKLEELYKVSLDEEDLNRKEYGDRIPLTKDLTEIIERLALTKGKQPKDESPEIVLQKIPKSNVAVFQSIKRENDADLMRAQVKELNTLMARENAVLNSDGTVDMQSTVSSKKGLKKTDNVIQISDDEDQEEGDILKCKICDLQFSTQKTLKFHMKYKHLDSRLVYPCPDCLEIFSTSWSVYRHLFKVHRKTAAQIRRLRESIQAKAFKMNNPPAFYEKRKNNAKNTTPQKITEEERLDQENQAWMDNMEGDGEVPRCGGCGRTFERRAALAAHTHTCQPRSRALARRPDARKIEIQIRKDYNKAPPPAITLPLKIADSNDNTKVSEESTEKSKSPKQVESKVEDECIVKDKTKKSTQDTSNDSLLTKQCTNESQNIKSKSNEDINAIKLPFARQTELNNLNAFRKHCLADIEIEKLQCKKCDNKFSEETELHEHMAEHYKWLRYACKLCNFKNYNFEKLPEHVKIVHKLKGDADFYYSTVKAIDGTEALQLSDCTKDNTESSERSPDSRRPSRCSSDSSRLSDDSSCSSSRTEGKRKKRIKHNKNLSKKKKEATVITDDADEHKDSEASNDMLDENDSSSNAKAFEENSSDIDEVDEKPFKKLEDKTIITLSSRRPVRKRTYKKNEDFEYDLSNLLKMEAQGYRDSQTVVPPKPVQPKKKVTTENQNNNEICNKNYSGAMFSLARKAVATSSAQMRCSGRVFQGDVRATNVFLRPSLPKIPRVEKVSPKKDTPIQTPDTPTTNNVEKQDANDPIKLEKDETAMSPTVPKDQTTQDKKETEACDEENIDSSDQALNKTINNVEEPSTNSTNIPSKINVPSNLLPVKLRRQSLDLIQNPLIKKNMSEFSKAGMKTKILVIKPINRNKDGGKTINNPLKFQTIKLKESIKNAISNKEISSDQVRVVQVPKVECALKLPVKNTCIVRNDANLSTAAPSNAASSDTSSIMNDGKTLNSEDSKCDTEKQGKLDINPEKESLGPDECNIFPEDVTLEQEDKAISTES